MDEFFRRPHPALVHFPITLYPLSLVFLIVFLVNQNNFFLHASFWSLMLGVLTNIPTALTGWHDMNRTEIRSSQASRLMQMHMINGIIITAIGILAAVIFLWQPPMYDIGLVPLYTLFVIVLSILVFVQGALGGIMVYRHRMGVEEHG